MQLKQLKQWTPLKRWRSWQASMRGEMPEEVRQVLVSQFHLDPGVAGSLGYCSRNGEFAGRQVRQVRVFDRSQVASEGLAVRSYKDLNVSKGAVLFEGQVEKDGRVYLADRRHPKRINKVG